MTDVIQVQWSAGSVEEARKVCRFLVQERIVACAQITPWIESIYMWDNKLETEQETRVLLKTVSGQLEKVQEVILSNCKHEVPEIIWHNVDGGHAEYMTWVQDSTLSGVNA